MKSQVKFRYRHAAHTFAYNQKKRFGRESEIEEIKDGGFARWGVHVICPDDPKEAVEWYKECEEARNLLGEVVVSGCSARTYANGVAPPP